MISIVPLQAEVQLMHSFHIQTIQQIVRSTKDLGDTVCCGSERWMDNARLWRADQRSTSPADGYFHLRRGAQGCFYGRSATCSTAWLFAVLANPSVERYL